MEELRFLKQHLPIAVEDLVEMDIRRRGVGVLVYPRRRWPLAAMETLLGEISPGEAATTLLLTLLQRIPAERHALRRAENSVSLFFKIDIPAQGVEAIGKALGFSPFSRRASAYFTSRNRNACGIAVEVQGARPPRLRFYDMLGGAQDQYRSLSEALELFGIPFKQGREQERELNRALAKRAHKVVFNLGTSVIGDSIKLELPRVGFSLAQRLTPRTTDQITDRRARHLASQAGATHFSYLGLRYGVAGDTETTFYVACSSPGGAT